MADTLDLYADPQADISRDRIRRKTRNTLGIPSSPRSHVTFDMLSMILSLGVGFMVHAAEHLIGNTRRDSVSRPSV